MTLEQLYANIEQGVYGPDRGLFNLFCKSFHDDSIKTTPEFMNEFYASAEAGWARFEKDALDALGVTEDPHAKVLFAAAAVVGGGQEDLMKTFGMLRRMAVVLPIRQEAERKMWEEHRKKIKELREQSERELMKLEEQLEEEWQRELLDLEGPPSIMP